jgi:hypothetical protein
MGSGLPQFGLPRRLAIVGFALPLDGEMRALMIYLLGFLKTAVGFKFELKNQSPGFRSVGTNRRENR